jgi:hypothetical protein
MGVFHKKSEKKGRKGCTSLQIYKGADILRNSMIGTAIEHQMIIEYGSTKFRKYEIPKYQNSEVSKFRSYEIPEHRMSLQKIVGLRSVIRLFGRLPPNACCRSADYLRSLSEISFTPIRSHKDLKSSVERHNVVTRRDLL